MKPRTTIVLAIGMCCGICHAGAGQEHRDASSSLIANAMAETELAASTPGPDRTDSPPLGLADLSLFYVPTPEEREFAVHDLVQIIVRESSSAKSIHELETKKEFEISADVTSFPDIRIEDLLNFMLQAGRTSNLPTLGMKSEKEFTGEGEYKRQDDLTARLTAEVIEVLPNGNLILEARTTIRTDEELSLMTVTGICRPEDVGAGNTILSNQIHDLKIAKDHSGELKKTNEKGILSRFFDFFFAW